MVEYFLLTFIKKFNKKGFTLIELLVVISIIGLLSSVVLAALGQAKTKAQIARTQLELRQLGNVLTIVKDESDKLFWEINAPATGASYSSACSTACLPACGLDLRNVAIGNICYDRWVAILGQLVLNSNGIYSNLDAFSRDVWGSPYVVDENEGVIGTQCGTDYIASPGPDGIKNGGTDDIVFRAPFKSLGKVFIVPDNGSLPNPTYNKGNLCKCVAVNNCQQINPPLPAPYL